MTHFSFLKKLKGLSPLETSLSVVWFLFLSLCLFCSFLYLDYGGLRSRVGVTWSRHASALVGPSAENAPSMSVSLRQGRGGDGGDGGVVDSKGSVGNDTSGAVDCDLFDGRWVWDETYPLYDSKDCMFLDGGFRCSENGRPDDFYAKWRWQPKHCNLPRFNATTLLEKLRNRRLVFVGDSIGRNQWESLLCMLASAVPDKTSIYEVNGRPITKHTGSLAFLFRDLSCSIEYYRAPFLVVQGRAPAGAPKEVKTTLKVDKLDWSSSQWKDADVLIFNTGHWWNYAKTLRGGCYFEEGNEVKMNMSVQSAFQRSIETLSAWVDSQVNLSKTRIFFRSYSPVHFSCRYHLSKQQPAPAAARAAASKAGWRRPGREASQATVGTWARRTNKKTGRGMDAVVDDGRRNSAAVAASSSRAMEVSVGDKSRGGDWKHGGSCHLETLPNLSLPSSPKTWSHFNIVNDVLSKHIYSTKAEQLHLLNVTYMSDQRKDGHASVYYVGPKPASLRRQDCSHWCLPGVPDTWNELLYAVLLKEDHL